MGRDDGSGPATEPSSRSIGPVPPGGAAQIGPPMPPTTAAASTPSNAMSIGPSRPPTVGPTRPSIGPARPTPSGPAPPPADHEPTAPTSTVSASSGGSIGPALPPGFSRKRKAAAGPAAPETGAEKATAATAAPPARRVCGPARPPQQLLDLVADSMTKDDGIGPRLASAEEVAAAEARDHRERLRMLEERSESAKKVLTGTEAVARESWMTELPDLVRKDFGTGARTFRSKSYTVEKDTGWTDTPAERAAREAAKAQRTAGLGPAKPSDDDVGPSDRDVLLAAQVHQHNAAKRGESLMDMHKKKESKRKAEEEAKGGSGFSWDRERDMAISMSDPKKRKAAMNSTEGFSARFAPARGQHFL